MEHSLTAMRMHAAIPAFFVMVRSFSSLTQFSSSALMSACMQPKGVGSKSPTCLNRAARPGRRLLPGRWACTEARGMGHP